MSIIKTSTGSQEISIERDGKIAGVITFNPSDVLFAERFYALIGELEIQMAEYKARGAALDAVKEKDANNIPDNMGERIALLRETCEYMRGRIDHLFGADTSQKAFGDTLNMDMFEQFFTGVTPFFRQARAEKVAQYTTPASAKRNKRKL